MGLSKPFFNTFKSPIMIAMKNTKFVHIYRAIISFLFVVMTLTGGLYIFHTFYYEPVYIFGLSMAPTLNGQVQTLDNSIVDFGIIDSHQRALKRIQRFAIVSTYYPDESDYDLQTNVLKKDARKKIKRVIALPNETFEIRHGLLYVFQNDEFKLVNYPFKTLPLDTTNYIEKDTTTPITLLANEYWVLGDNRPNSFDSATINKPIKYDNLQGVLVAIEGKGKLYIKNYSCNNCGRKYNETIETCQDCNNEVAPVYDLKDKQYSWPKYF